jgi:16S rRNA G966 N2-methylase RsmD
MEDDDLEYLNRLASTPKKKAPAKKRATSKKSPSKKATPKKAAPKNIKLPDIKEIRDEEGIRTMLKKRKEAAKIWKRDNAEAIQKEKERKEALKNRVFLTLEEVAAKRAYIEEEDRKKREEIDEYMKNFQGISLKKEVLDRIFHKPIDTSDGMRILEPEIPAYIRHQKVPLPRATPMPPKEYTGPVGYGDMVDFYFKINEFETAELRGRVRNFLPEVFEILGFDGKVYHLPYSDTSIVVRTSFLQKKSLKSNINLSDFEKTKVTDDESSTSIRAFVVRIIMHIIFEVISGITGEKIPTLKELGLPDEEAGILRKHMIRFNDSDVTCVYKAVTNNDYVKGIWEYSFFFGDVTIREEILVPSFADEKKLSPLLEDSFCMMECKKWLESQLFLGKNEEGVAINNLAAKIAKEQFDNFNNVDYVVDLLLVYLDHPKQNLYNCTPPDVILKMDENNLLNNRSDAYILSLVEKQYKENQTFKQTVKERIDKSFQKGDMGTVAYLQKEWAEAEKSKEQILQEITERRNIVTSIRKLYFMDLLLSELARKMRTIPEKTTRSDLMISISIAVEDFKKRMEQYGSAEEGINGLIISMKIIMIKEFIDAFNSNHPKFSMYFDTFMASHKIELKRNYEAYFSKYLKAKQKVDAAYEKIKENSDSIKRVREKVEKAYGKNRTGRSDFLHLVLTHEYQRSDITKKGYDVLYEIKEYEAICFHSIKESERTVWKYMKKVLYPFLFLQGTFKKHTKHLQTLLDKRIVSIKSLAHMQLEDLFPELAMQFSGEKALEKRIQDRIKARLETDEKEYVQRNIEQYIFSIDRTYVKTISYVPGEDFWRSYIADISQKCSEAMNEDISKFTKENTTVYYDSFTNSFVCYDINEVIKDIRDTDKYIHTDEEIVYKDASGRIYPSAFIKKIKKIYEDTLKEEAMQKNALRLYFIYDNQLSDIYKKFMGKVGELYQTFPTINISIKHKKDAKELIKKLDIHSFPIVVCTSEDASELFFKTESLEELIHLLEKVAQEGYIQDDLPTEYDVSMNFRNMGKETIVKGIREGSIPFPYAYYYIKNPFEFIGYRPYAKIQKKVKKVSGDYGKVLIYDDNDYEKLDILTNYFTEKARVQGVFTKDGNTKSLLEWWKEKAPEIVDKAIEYADQNGMIVNAKAFREGMYLLHLPECTNFKISSAIAIYNEFKPKVVLDPFSGWGDRALGSLFANTVERYIGVDPNSLLREGYEGIQNFAKEYFHSKKIDFVYSTIEEFLSESYLPKEGVDLVFSSPPYYNYEIYTEEETQSVQRYQSEKEWTAWFHKQTYTLFKMVKKGGYLVYYLGTCGNLKIPQNLKVFMEKNFGKSAFLGSMETQSKTKKKRPLYYYIWQKK